MSKLSIVKRVLAALNLTEEGKVENFFNKQITALTKDIKNLGKNIDTVKDQKAEALEELAEKLEDVKVRVEEAYAGVTVENVASNETATRFADIYWARVSTAEEAVVALEADIKNTTECYDEKLKNIEEQVAKRQARLDILSATVA